MITLSDNIYIKPGTDGCYNIYHTKCRYEVHGGFINFYSHYNSSFSYSQEHCASCHLYPFTAELKKKFLFIMNSIND